jgi:hypothetical protein
LSGDDLPESIVISGQNHNGLASRLQRRAAVVVQPFPGQRPRSQVEQSTCEYQVIAVATICQITTNQNAVYCVVSGPADGNAAGLPEYSWIVGRKEGKTAPFGYVQVRKMQQSNSLPHQRARILCYDVTFQ